MKRICILTCGGTVTMVRDNKGVLQPQNVKFNFVKEVPELTTIAKVSTVEITNIDGSNMDPTVWVKLILKLKQVYSKYDGFVIIHGTDTMAFTASAVSYAITHLNKTIVFTGSQKPLADIATDARNNIINSVLVACSNLHEVCIVFGSSILRGNRSSKVSESNFNAFESPMYSPLGAIGLKPEIYSNKFKKTAIKTEFTTHFDASIEVLKLHPGFQTTVVEKILTSTCKGVVIEGFGAGNIPDKLVSFLDEAAKKSIPVIILSQCHRGITKMQLYKVGYQAYEHGAISGVDMTSESAITKLMWALGKTRDLSKIRKIFATNLAGEVTLDDNNRIY